MPAPLRGACGCTGWHYLSAVRTRSLPLHRLSQRTDRSQLLRRIIKLIFGRDIVLHQGIFSSAHDPMPVSNTIVEQV
jgi:hypothetical protein